jgi:AcrR family transcriptional regulator
MTIVEGLTKGERTRQVVIDAAYSLFIENGFSATSMRQIAERAGLALGGIYNHFPSKDEIFQALIINKHPYMRIIPVLEKAPGKNIEEFIRNAVSLLQKELGNDPNFIKLMFIEIVEFNGKHFPKLLELIFPLALPLIERFTTEGFGVRPSIAPLKLVRFLMGNLLAFYLTELVLADESVPSGLREIKMDDFVEVFLYGILENSRAQD